MSTVNPVFQVLVTKGNLPLLEPNKMPTDLKVGQLGVFDFETNLSISELLSESASFRGVYLAVGIDRDGDGVTDDILTSAGQVIQFENITGATGQCYVAGVNQIIEVANFKAQCETDYGIKIEIKNQSGYLTNGYNQVTKTFMIKTSCCNKEDCTSCPEGDCNEVAIKLVKNINEDVDKILKASLVTPNGTILKTDAQLATWLANPDNVGACLKFRVEVLPLGIKKFCTINLGYFNPRSTTMNLSLVEGFNCNGTATEIQAMVNEQGKGYDIAQMEYFAGGWNGKPGPYRVSSVVAMPVDSFESYVDQNANYVQINLTYNQFSVAGWLEHLNNLNTIIAVPVADSNTLEGLEDLFSNAGRNIDITNCASV